MNEKLASELLHRSAADQAMRNAVIETGDMSLWDDQLDKQNTEYLQEIVNAEGWPTISKVGEEAAQSAWLLVQHADHKPEFQATCLELLKALPDTEVRPANVAYLEDRVRVSQGRPQLYGTQFYKEGGTFGPRPIEDEGLLDERRASMGLESFEANQRRILKQYGNLG
jgi:hypothetical protein